MPEADQPHIVVIQYEELAEWRPDFTLTSNEDGSFLIAGDLSFSAEWDGITIADTFALEITVPSDYPSEIPIVIETGGRIPRDREFHAHPDGPLCLDVPLELRKMFQEGGTLLGFVKHSIVNFLYSHCFKETYGKMPFGEWSHGGKGIAEYYRTGFRVKGDKSVVLLLNALAEEAFSRRQQCPCGS